MNIKDLIVISLILSIIFWAIFHQMASKYINSNEILKKKIFGIDIYKNKSMDKYQLKSKHVFITKTL